jgi:hypothetical protein
MPSDASGKLWTKDLIAPAAVLGPNHWPTSFPSSFPASAILCTLNGHRVDGESKNHVKIWT